MSADFLDLMHLFSCGALGKEPNAKEYNINEILRLSSEQGVFAVVFLSLEKLYNKKCLTITEHDFAYLKSQYTQAVFSSIRKNAAVNIAVQQLKNSGFDCVMLKGQILSGLYAVPETRISGDTDLLLPSAGMEHLACQALEKIGFETIKRPDTSHHAMCKRADAGLIELHLSLYDEIFEDLWFNNRGEKREEYINITTKDGYTYKTLSYTDNAVFITLHAIKHFFSEGVGIRQIADMLLFNKTYKDEINWEKYNKLMEKLKFKKLVDHIYEIGRRYLDIDICKTSDIDEKNIEDILYDIETGGLFGKEDKSRKDFYMEATKERSQKDDSEYDEYIRQWKGNISLKRKLFPPESDMKKAYNILNNHAYLLPVFWIVRLIKIFAGKIKPKKINDKRLELLKNLDII